MQQAAAQLTLMHTLWKTSTCVIQIQLTTFDTYVGMGPITMSASIPRDDAIVILASDRLAKMSADARVEQLECMMCEDWTSDPEWQHLSPDIRREFEDQSEVVDPTNSRYDAPLLLSLKERFTGATNNYLSDLLNALGHHHEAVVGTQPELAACPCCGACSLDERGEYDICSVCWWEDDGQDNHNADKVMGGPNYHLSLTQARINFLISGISDPQRTDLLALQDPAGKYAQGRVFVLAPDGLSVAEPTADWQGTVRRETGS